MKIRMIVVVTSLGFYTLYMIILATKNPVIAVVMPTH